MALCLSLGADLGGQISRFLGFSSFCSFASIWLKLHIKEMEAAPPDKTVVLGHFLPWSYGMSGLPRASLGGERRRCSGVLFSGVRGWWGRWAATTH
jgi:hypothetical protein